MESRKLLWGNDITTEAGHPLGRLEIFEGEEAINVVDAFAKTLQMTSTLAMRLAFEAISSTSCANQNQSPALRGCHWCIES